MTKMHLTVLPLLLAVGVVSNLGANFVGATLSAHHLVEMAQHEGAAFPHGNPQAPPPTFGSRGTAERKCVEFPPRMVQIFELLEIIAGRPLPLRGSNSEMRAGLDMSVPILRNCYFIWGYPDSFTFS